MKALIPKQHGAWAMLLIPFLLGMIKGGPVFWHIPLFLGWLFLYLAVYPITLALKKKQIKSYQKWIYYYGVLACCFLIIPVFHKPPLIMVGVS
ncbi:YwiC-like family protein, partial [Bacillus spizizenii]|nr:YwiC-like family protein [Bacillus spizizenii]